jgi:uncharacterized protein YecE (DUF72 family)
LDKLLVFFKDVPVAVEFRNAEWLNNRVIDAFRERNIPLVALDMPSMKGLPPTLEVVTGPLAYIRLHGRNQETWWGSDSTARYDYRYSDKELEAWGDRIMRIVIKSGFFPASPAKAGSWTPRHSTSVPLFINELPRHVIDKNRCVRYSGYR